MMVVEKEMEGRSDDDLEELTSIFEQCVYCLYGHPNKRGRAKHLNDHNCSQVTLTWERSGTVFHHFATQSVPEFDSYKTSTVTADVENLLRRIFALVPEKINPNQGLAAITDYIEGSANSVSTIPAMTIDKNLDPYNISGLLYYLLGDFYFKSKEQTKAVKLYQLDLVLNVNRLDSWAGLSLAKMSQIEQKLNSTELKIEKPIHKNSEGALRCFRRAVELEAGSCKLWLEYGSLAYQLHSHASRQMKYKDMFSLTEEVLQIAMSRRLDLLLVAKNSYLQASRCEGEDTEEGWLTFYMMGKVAEKQLEHPSVYLEYYKQAAACLHEEKAVYPKKIQFVIPPPHLALEALEVFYRIHVCSLKLILSGCGDDYLTVLDSYVTYTLQGHFATGEEKQQKIVEEDKPVVREEEFATPKSTTTSNSLKPQQIYHKNPVHHEYSRHKSTSDSQSEGEEPKCNNPSKASTGGHTSDLGQEEDKSTNHLISNSAVVDDNAGLDTVSISDNVGLDTVSSADNIGLNNVSKSVSYVGPVNINTDIHPSRLYVMDSSNIPERAVADADNSCESSLKQGFVSSVISVSDVQIQQDIDMVDEMETGEVETMSELAAEVEKKASAVRNFSERILGQDVGHDQQDENSFGSMTDIGQCEVSTGVVSCQVMKSGDEGMIGNSQSNSKDNSQDNLPENDYQMSSQDGSQDSVRIEETSEEDTAAMSCGNEADVDTDAMDVDEDVMSATSQDSAETSFEISSHVSNLEHSSDNLKTKVGEIVVEVHAGDDVHEISTGISFIPPGLYHHVTQGFIPHSENLEILHEKTLDIDSFEDDQKHNEKCRDTSLADHRTNVAACIINQAEIAGEIPLDGNGKNMQDPTGKVCSQHVDDMSDLLGETEVVIEKDEIISINRVSQDQQSEKSSKEISRNKPEGISNNCQIIEALKNGMDAGGDLKDTGKMETQRFDTEDNNEDEKWEKESQEKHSDQILEPSAQSMIVSDISETENVTSAELAVPVLETSANKSPRPTSINNSSTLGDTGLNKLTSEEPNDSKTLSKDSELLKDVLISKCRSGLEMCASRFSSHYKSLYRLAHLYYSTKELDKARDILLGRPDWQDQPHMPTAGLFSERKQNNFFQGLWKLPVEDIDRSGCFASHVHRSVKLLLEVLCDVGDLEMLKNLHNQLRKTPESGKKYLRDAERLVLAEEAFLKCVNVVQHEMDMSDHWSEEQREENLFRIYHVWVSGKGCKHADRVTDALHRAFKIMMKGRTDVNRLTAAQAISFCQQNLTKSLTPSTPTPSSAQNKPGSQSGAERAKDGSVPSTERVKDGPILSRESAKDGSVVPLEGAKDELVVSTESAKDGSVVPTEGAKDGSLVPPEGAIDGSVVPTEGAKDGLAVAAESVNESAVATEGAKDGSIVSIESANGSAVSTEGAKDGSVVSIESANGSAVSTEGAKDGSVVSIESANGSAIPTDGGVDGTVVSLKKEEADKQSEPMEVCVKQEDVMKTSQEVQQSVDVNNSRSSSSSTPAITEQTITESKKAHDDDDDDDVIILSD